MEEWKSCSYNDEYAVSNTGRVRRIDGKVLSLYRAAKTGYLQVRIGGRKKHSVHRLVAMEFCSGYFDGAVVNHKNGERDDNRADNLEWVTQSENIRHGFSHLGAVAQQKGKNGHEHHTSKPVVRTCIASGETKYYQCAYDARHEGFDSGMISKCCNGLSKSHKGHRWEFALDGTHRAYRELSNRG